AAVLGLDERAGVEPQTPARRGERGPDTAAIALGDRRVDTWRLIARDRDDLAVGHRHQGGIPATVRHRPGPAPAETVQDSGLEQSVVVAQRLVVSARYQDAAVGEEGLAGAEQLADLEVGAGGVRRLGEAADRVPDLGLAGVPPEEELAGHQLD